MNYYESITSHTPLLLRRDSISTAETSGKARVLPSLWRSYADCQHAAISSRTSTKPSATILFADYAARALNDVYLQRRICHSRKLWKLPKAWRQRTVMQNLSKDPLLLFTRFDPCQRHQSTNRRTRNQRSIHERHVTVAVDQTTIRGTAGLWMPLVTTARKKGHIAPACRSKKNATGKATPRLTARANFVGTDALEPNEELNSEDCLIGNTFCISRLDESRSHPFTTEMEVNGKTLTMEIDTGAIISAEAALSKSLSGAVSAPTSNLHGGETRRYWADTSHCPSSRARKAASTSHSVRKRPFATGSRLAETHPT